jgi:hypothetical protein
MGGTTSQSEYEKDASKYYLTTALNDSKIVDCIYSIHLNNCQQITQYYCNQTNSHGFLVFQTIGSSSSSSSSNTFLCHLSGMPNQLYISTEKTEWNPNSRVVNSCDVSIESFRNFNADFAKRFGEYNVKTNNCQTFAEKLSIFFLSFRSFQYLR